MATIIKRKSKYSVVYYFIDKNGEKKQRWETVNTYKEALKRKAEVEHEIIEGTFIAPNNQTVSDFMQDYVSLYGEKNWSLSTYDGNVGLLKNYINPLIGDVAIQDITPRFVDQFYKKLEKTPPVSSRNRKPKAESLTPQTREKIHKLLKCAFKQAVRWEIISRNPFDVAMMQRPKYKRRDIWDADTIRKALDECTDGKLYVAINLSFACSLREGEILGLMWNNVHISDDDIGKDDAHVYIDKELMRASKNAIEALDKKDVYHIFPPLMPNTSTRVILKKPKTDSSIRKVWLPKTLAYILREWKQHQDNLIELLGDEYQNYNLVVALQNGRPCEGRVLLKAFEALRLKAGLPNVVFHSLRHSSTTYKLKLNHGDLKATQGDTGHAQIDMITDIYAHILDEDRKVNATKFEQAFYSINADLRKVKPPEEKQTPELDVQSLLKQLQQSPELLQTLAGLLEAQKRGTK